MADSEISSVAAPVAPAASAAPVATESAVSSAPVAAPVTESAPIVTTAPIAAAETKSAESSLLSVEPVKETKIDPKPEVKDGEKNPEATTEIKPEVKTEAESKPEAKTDEAPALPTYEPFKLPEGFKADDKALGEFSGLVGQLELAKGDHAKTQEIGQKMVDLFAVKMSEAMKIQSDYFVTLHNQDKQKQLDELKADAYFGAGGDEVARTKIQLEFGNFLQRNIPKQDLVAFKNFVDSKGIENALPLAKVLNTLKQKIDQYEKEPDTSKTMLAANKPQPTSKFTPGKNVMQTLYGAGSK